MLSLDDTSIQFSSKRRRPSERTTKLPTWHAAASFGPSPLSSMAASFASTSAPPPSDRATRCVPERRGDGVPLRGVGGVVSVNGVVQPGCSEGFSRGLGPCSGPDPREQKVLVRGLGPPNPKPRYVQTSNPTHPTPNPTSVLWADMGRNRSSSQAKTVVAPPFFTTYPKSCLLVCV